ncbi:MAG: leucine-rich repeat domain-containing protein [Aeriscardovia sp.]|nr:leucine-rich repeat domain-containing protein [Aeriscardovia sp.]
MKKKLFTLLLCVFAVLGANAAKPLPNGLSVDKNGSTLTITSNTSGLISNVFSNTNPYTDQINSWKATPATTTLILVGSFNKDDLDHIKNNILTAGITTLNLEDASIPATYTLVDKYKTNLQTLSMPNSESYTSIPENFAVDCTTLTDLTLGSHITTIGTQAFKGCTSLADVDFSTATSLETIGESAFMKTGITNIELSSSVKYIEQGAFTECESLQSLTIPEDSKLVYIQSMSFRNLNQLTDVYVNVPVHANTAGDQGTLETAPEYIPWCELNAFDFESLVDQTDVLGHKQAMLHFPDGDDNFAFYCGKGGKVLSQSNLNDVKDHSTNGWRQFARTGSSREIPVIGGMFCTYSTNTPYLLPEGIKVYRATKFVGAKDGGTVTLTEITYSSNSTSKSGGIPKNTGVILKGSYSLDNQETVSKFYLDTPKDGDTFTEYPYETADANIMNYLVGTFGGGAYIEAADRENGKVTYRNFGFKVTKNADGSPTDDAVFMRTKKGNMPAEKAYLKLPASISEMLAEVNDGPGYDTAAPSSSAKVTLVFEDADFTQTTSLQNVDEIVKNADNNYYTLEGVKVNAPTVKGIYVRNGKKIVVK